MRLKRPLNARGCLKGHSTRRSKSCKKLRFGEYDNKLKKPKLDASTMSTLIQYWAFYLCHLHPNLNFLHVTKVESCKIINIAISDEFIYTIPNSAPFRGRVVERSVERSETEGLIRQLEKRKCSLQVDIV